VGDGCEFVFEVPGEAACVAGCGCGGVGCAGGVAPFGSVGGFPGLEGGQVFDAQAVEVCAGCGAGG